MLEIGCGLKKLENDCVKIKNICNTRVLRYFEFIKGSSFVTLFALYNINDIEFIKY